MGTVVQLRRPEQDDGQDQKKAGNNPMSHGAVFSNELHEVDLGNLDDETGDGTLNSSLLQHLKTLAGDRDVAQVIQLLKDIRTHQDHPDMQEAFAEHDHPIAHKAADHSADVLELLVEDYLKHNNITEDEGDKDAHSHKPGLELHVKHVVMDTLKGYQEVVENIRNEVGSVADQLKQDDSIAHVRDMVGQIQKFEHTKEVKTAIDELSPYHNSHHIFHGHSDDIDHALATAAHQKGYRTHEQASEYIKDEFHEELNKHFGEALNLAATGRGSKSDVFIKNIGIEKIQRARVENDRINAAFSLMEGLQNRLGNDAENVIREELDPQDSHSAHLLKVIDDDSSDDIEHSFISQSSSAKLDIEAFADKTENLAALYIRACGQTDYKIRAGMLKLEQAKKVYAGNKDLASSIPSDCHELDVVLRSDGSVEDGIVKYWLQTDFGNLENLDRILDKVATDAQSYLDPDLLKNITIPARQEFTTEPSAAANVAPVLEPYPEDEAETAERMKLISEVKMAAPGTALYSLSQVMRAAAANYKSYPPLSEAVLSSTTLHSLVAWFEEEKGGRPEGMVDTYLKHKREAGPKAKSFDAFVDTLLLRVQDNCDEDLYRYLMKWDKRETIGVTVPPPSYAGGGENIPLTTMASATGGSANDVQMPSHGRTGFEAVPVEPSRAPGIAKQPEVSPDQRPTVPPPGRARKEGRQEEDRAEEGIAPPSRAPVKVETAERPFDESALELRETPYVYECDTLSVKEGEYAKLAYAMPSSTVEVEDGAVLDLFMANDDVTVVLKGKDSRVKIEKATRNCSMIHVVDADGNIMTAGPNVELGKGVLEKLTA